MSMSEDRRYGTMYKYVCILKRGVQVQKSCGIWRDREEERALELRFFHM